MRAALTLAVLGAAFAAAGAAHGHSTRSLTCPGAYRWRVATLADAAASSLSATPVSSSIERLAHLPVPTALRRTTARLQSESVAYTVRGRLVSARLQDPQRSNGDIVVVLADPRTGARVSAHFPEPACAPALHSRYHRRMAQARAAFVRSCGQPSADHADRLGGSATIVAFAFFAPPQKRVGAPNGVQLHPVLTFRTQGCLRPR
jgi:hypothetical protein